MTYFLDANTIIFYLRGQNPTLRAKIESVSIKDINIPSVVKGELITGAYKKHDVKKELKLVTGFVDGFEIVPFDSDASMIYGKIRSELEAKGKGMGPNDTLIAATVMSRGGILVTNNINEFERVEGLRIEDWST